MNALWYYAIGFVVIWIVALIFKDKLVNYGVDVNFPTIMWKTKRLRGFIDKIANLSPKFWKWFMNIGIVISFGAMITIAYMLLSSLSTIVDTPSVSLVIPGVEIPGSPIFIPFVYGIIGLATVIIVHEFAHGILARREKVGIKSIGLLLFAVLPGAFVEPEEEEIKNIKKISRMRIYGAGSIANLSFALIAILITLLISSIALPATFQENGIEIDRVIDGAPASNILKSGMIIKSINGHNVSDVNSYSEAILTLKSGEMVDIVTDQGKYNFTAGTNPNNKSLGYMGIQAVKNFEVKSDVANVFGDQLPWAWFSLLEMFNWIFFLNLAVGLFNILPMKPLDGGYLLEDLLRYKLSDKIVKPAITILSWFFIFIIAISLIAGIGNGLL
ncbi:MAG: site-2 protease family protein [Methanobacteriaceae archaeon]|nr:site-2 protease family protein [Candidatus Methanorudis spinitermitis]